MVLLMDEKQIKNVLKKRDWLLASAKTLGISVLVDEESHEIGVDTPEDYMDHFYGRSNSLQKEAN